MGKNVAMVTILHHKDDSDLFPNDWRFVGTTFQDIKFDGSF